MKYNKNLQKIMSELAAYKKEIDRLTTDYKAERSKFEEEMDERKNKFTTEYIQEARENWTPKKDYAKLINTARTTHQNNIDECFNGIESELNGYFSTPPNSELIALVTTVKNTEITLKNKELELLKNMATGYWDSRILESVASSRTLKREKVISNGTSTPDLVKVDEPRPFCGISTPDIDDMYGSFENVVRGVNEALKNYCGIDNALKDVMFGASKLDTVTIVRMATAENYFNKDWQGYTELIDMMNMIPKPKKKTELTESDRQLIDSIIDPKYPALGANKAIEVARLNEELKEILLLDKRYSAAIKEALGVEDEEQGNGWSNAGKKTENSDRATGIKIAQESAMRMQAENHGDEILNNYRR